MKEIRIVCPHCFKPTYYDNWFSWILHTPVHRFKWRKVKCQRCGKRSYVKLTTITNV